MGVIFHNSHFKNPECPPFLGKPFHSLKGNHQLEVFFFNIYIYIYFLWGSFSITLISRTWKVLHFLGNHSIPLKETTSWRCCCFFIKIYFFMGVIFHNSHFKNLEGPPFLGKPFHSLKGNHQLEVLFFSINIYFFDGGHFP